MRLATPVLLITLLLAGCASPPTPAPPPGNPPGLTARGIGTVNSTPDRLTVVLGVQNRGRGAQETLDANSRLATATIDALRAAGVADADLRTSQLSVSPTQDPTTGRVTGYEVNNLLTATLRDIGRAGSVIDAAGVAAGDAVRVQQLEFSVADDSAPRARARADAVRKAQEQARQLAEAAGVTLGTVRSITEVPTDPGNPYERDAKAAAQAAVPILPGTQELQVAVEIVYDLG
jgi:uncharacterized protein YggE